MAFSPVSFALGMVTAALLPAVARVFRPFAVEATAAGMGMFEDARRFVSEQVETIEDMMAEAKARREQLDAEEPAASEEPSEEEAEAGAPDRRRTNGRMRRRPVDTPR